MQSLPTATELFATPPHTRPNAVKPRIVSVLEHVPAPVPQHVEAQSVRAMREAAPTYTPPGSELFVAAAPKKWDVPALDYGSALRQVQPPQVAVVTPKSIEPTRIVARELPRVGDRDVHVRRGGTVRRAAAGGDGACETRRRSARAGRRRTQRCGADFRQYADRDRSARGSHTGSVTPPASPTPVAAAVPASKPLFVSTPPKLPAASELNMSHVAAAPAPAARARQAGRADARCGPRLAAGRDRDVHLGPGRDAGDSAAAGCARRCGSQSLRKRRSLPRRRFRRRWRPNRRLPPLVRRDLSRWRRSNRLRPS